MRTDDLYLIDILDAADAIALFLRETDFELFSRDDKCRSALLWKLMIIGEASTRLSQRCREAFREVPWDQIKGFRNVMVHSYFSLHWPEVWRIVTLEVPRLRRQAQQILAAEFPETYHEWQEERTDGPA